MSALIFPEVPRPAVPTPKRPTLHPALTEFRDFQISFFMRERAGEPVRLWNLVNHVVSLDRPPSGQARRRITLQVLERLKALIKGGFLVRWGRTHLTLAGTPMGKPPQRRAVRGRRRKQLSTAQARALPPVHASVAAQPTAQNQCEQQKSAAVSDCADNKADSAVGGKTKSDTNRVRAVSREQLAAAASQVAKLPRKPVRVWTGWINGVHFWRGREVLLPDGRIEQVYAVYRGLVGLAVSSTDEFRPRELLFRAEQLRVWRNPAAQTLGGAKRGVVEQKSQRKAESARLNGSRPTRPGSKPRGRPRRA